MLGDVDILLKIKCNHIFYVNLLVVRWHTVKARKGSTALHENYFQYSTRLTCVHVEWLSNPRRRCMNSLTTVLVQLDSPESNTKMTS